MRQGLNHMLPGHEISVPVAAGPFEDDQGNPAWFTKGKGAQTPAKMILELKKDFLTSVAAALRAVKAHRPTVVVADGQGALVALGLANALCLETCLAMRNVQLPEIPPLAKAWGAIRAVVVSTPRWGKASLDVERLRRAVPEMFDLSSPWEGLPTTFVVTKHSPLHSKEVELCERLRLVTVPKIQDVLLLQMLERPAKLMWEHNGKCMCGRRTFLHGLCD